MSSNLFSSVELRLKQVDVPGLGALGRYVFDSAFGSYSSDDNTVGEATSKLSRAYGGAPRVTVASH